MTPRFVEKLINGLTRRVFMLLARGIIQAVDDSGGIQKQQISFLNNETIEGIERLHEYGLTSVPLKDAEAFCLFIGGRREHGFVIATDDRRYRPKGLNPGELCLYTFKNNEGIGHRILFKENGDLEIKALGNHTRDITLDETKSVGGNEVKTVLGGVTSNITLNEIKNITGNHSKVVGGNISEVATGTALLKGSTVTVQDTAGNQVKIGGPETEVTAATKVKITAPAIELNGTVTINGNIIPSGNLTVTGNISATGTILDSTGNTNNHSHP